MSHRAPVSNPKSGSGGAVTLVHCECPMWGEHLFTLLQKSHNHVMTTSIPLSHLLLGAPPSVHCWAPSFLPGAHSFGSPTFLISLHPPPCLGPSTARCGVSQTCVFGQYVNSQSPSTMPTSVLHLNTSFQLPTSLGAYTKGRPFILLCQQMSASFMLKAVHWNIRVPIYPSASWA